MFLGVIAKICHRGIGFKKCCCGNPYLMAGAVEFMKGETDFYTFEVDGAKVLENIETMSVAVLNCKFGAQNICCAPAVLNDGLLDLTYATRKFSTSETNKMMKLGDRKFGGVH